MPDIDLVAARDLGIRGLGDPELLQLASNLGRIVLTHDRRTMIDFAYVRIADGKPFPGLIYVPDWLGIGRAIEELELLLVATHPSELEGRVSMLPLRR
ncbi:MAG: DUF5615 family PIN-like protein [Tepidiformaceae bacterium]